MKIKMEGEFHTDENGDLVIDKLNSECDNAYVFMSAMKAFNEIITDYERNKREQQKND